jgi:hypothetical protein
VDLLRLPPQRHPPRRLLSLLLLAFGSFKVAQGFGKMTLLTVHSANSLCDQQSRFAPLPTVTESSGVISDTHSSSYCVRTYPGL